MKDWSISEEVSVGRFGSWGGTRSRTGSGTALKSPIIMIALLWARWVSISFVRASKKSCVVAVCPDEGACTLKMAMFRQARWPIVPFLVSITATRMLPSLVRVEWQYLDIILPLSRAPVPRCVRSDAEWMNLNGEEWSLILRARFSGLPVSWRAK
jgi:hypothetical protein